MCVLKIRQSRNYQRSDEMQNFEQACYYHSYKRKCKCPQSVYSLVQVLKKYKIRVRVWGSGAMLTHLPNPPHLKYHSLRISLIHKPSFNCPCLYQRTWTLRWFEVRFFEILSSSTLSRVFYVSNIESIKNFSEMSHRDYKLQ